MLVFIDIETSGLDRLKHNMLSLGAITEDGVNQIYFDCKLLPGEDYSPEALKINGMSVARAYDENLPTRFDVYHDFSLWMQDVKDAYCTDDIILAGENIASFDILMLSKGSSITGEINLDRDNGWKFGHRFFDVHTLATAVLGKSMSQDRALQALGLEPEPKPHNALTGAKTSLRLYNALTPYFGKKTL